jgi:hypothetical protein
MARKRKAEIASGLEALRNSLLLPISKNFFHHHETRGFKEGELLLNITKACWVLEEVVERLKRNPEPDDANEKYDLINSEYLASLSVFETLKVFLKRILRTEYLHNRLQATHISSECYLEELQKFIRKVNEHGSWHSCTVVNASFVIMWLSQNFSIQKKQELRCVRMM